MDSPATGQGHRKSTSTRPGSWRRYLFASPASALEGPAPSPLHPAIPPRRASSASSGLPLGPTRPAPAAITRSRDR
jgi:hypothetical protein